MYEKCRLYFNGQMSPFDLGLASDPQTSKPTSGIWEIEKGQHQYEDVAVPTF